MIQVRCFHDLSQADRFRNELNAINLSSIRPDPFSTFEFYENYLCNVESSSKAARLWLLLAFEGHRLVGYIALRRSLQRILGLPAYKIDLLTAHGSDRPHLVALQGHESPVRAAVYQYLLERRSEWGLLEFQEQEEESGLLPLPEQKTWSRYRLRRWPNLANGTIALRWSTTNAYFSALSKKTRSNISRQVRSLLAAGSVQYLSSDDPEVIKTLFELYQAVEKHSWKAQTQAGVGRDSRSLAYYARLMEPGQPMRIRIQVLIMNGIPIAGLISGSFAKGLYALHIVHDDRLNHLGPGSAVLLMGLRQAIEGGYGFFNLLRGFGYYKERWLARMSATESLQIYRVGSLFFWRRLLGDLKRQWESLLASAPPGDPVIHFNPVRREVELPPFYLRAESQAELPRPAESEPYTELIAQARRGKGEFLSARNLAAAMPFPT